MKLSALNFSLQASAVFHIDERILCRGEDVARNDDIGAPKVNDAVAVGDRVRHAERFRPASSL